MRRAIGLLRWTAFARDVRGAMSLEFALVAMVLTPLVIAAADFGRVSLEEARLAAAARAGLQYATREQAFAGDTDSIVEAVRRDAGDPTLAVETRRYCRCPEADADGDCNGGTCGVLGDSYIPMYVEVTVRKDFSMLIDYPGLQKDVSLTAVSTMRAR